MHLDAEIPYVEVWRSLRVGSGVKTPRSRRALAIAGYVVQVLEDHRGRQAVKAARADWRENGLVFPSEVGTEQDSHNVRRKVRDALELVPGIVPRSGRLRAAALLRLDPVGARSSDRGDLATDGPQRHGVTELAYRHELRPLLESGATVMDAVFAPLGQARDGDGDAV